MVSVDGIQVVMDTYNLTSNTDAVASDPTHQSVSGAFGARHWPRTESTDSHSYVEPKRSLSHSFDKNTRMMIWSHYYRVGMSQHRWFRVR
jgi:hypothetical protein